MHRALLLAACLVPLLSACDADAPSPQAQAWPEADALFRHDPRWLGSDGDYSTDLGQGRVLWLFGDTGVARSPGSGSDGSYFIRNSLGIQTGYDPSQAAIQFYWSQASGQPSSFFAERGGSWFWPGGAARVGRGLIICGQWLIQASPGPSGFAAQGSGAFFINDADADPATWQPQDAQIITMGDEVILGTATLVAGGYLYVYGTRGLAHDFVVARFPLAVAAAGDLSRGEFFSGGQWVAATSQSPAPDPIFSIGVPEASVHWEPSVGRYLMIFSEGYGATTLALRAAPAPEGPWTAPRTFFRPAESYLPGAFVYAGKAHPELRGAPLAVTYFPSPATGTPPLAFPNDGFARFVRVTF